MIAKSRVALLVCVVVLMSSGAARAYPLGLDTNSPDLPPAGVYLTPAQVHAEYTGPGLDILLSQVQHLPYANGAPGIAPPSHTPVNGGDLEHFGSSVSGMVSVNGGGAIPAQGSGPVSVLVSGYTPGDTGTFQTEMLSLDLNFGSGIMIRESPTLQSTGQTSITPIGGGMYHIDSFFDVFTELSLDGGNTWMPDIQGPAHVNLTSLPEPSTIALLGLGLCGLACRSWRMGRRAR
jgi:hypothetical protein